ncbi:hypothetical protein P280DRAFT_518874 [Massarina eburnea CBS 473.64]|uniref:Cytochrome b561 domain-containing protein n=1 Tax=Massarina eburnea CBS 473.64 TaxID=1395130 RepID=A0A6A6RZR4_9PLEO|nr:hypothetical protein P280DRAFT_518874 [Massarina eburnea CBS 473.64]
MFASSNKRPGWYLPFAILTLTFLLYVTIGLWFTEWMASGRYYRPPNALDRFLQPETVDALYDDARLHNALISLTEAVAKASSDWGESYESEGLKGLGKNLTEEVARLKAIEPPRKRRSLFNGGKSGDGEQGGLLGAVSSLLGGDKKKNDTSLGGSLLSGIGNSLVDGLATPAFFLGIGLGMGAENGLNLTTTSESKAQASKVASTLGEEAKGLNLVAQNLGSGLTAQIVPAFGNSTTSFPIGMAAFGLAQGIGQGTAMGLNLTQTKFLPMNSSDTMAIASNLGLGISGPIAGSIDISKAFGGFSGTGNQLNQMLPQIAAAAGQGLGEGASKGLGFMKANMTGSPFGKRQLTAGSDPNAMDIPGAVGNFTLGLSQSFLQSADLSKILGGMDMSSAGFSLDATALVSIASGAGKGVGEGVAVGLNMITATNGTLTSPTTGVNGINATQEQAAEQFVKNLLAGFLQNGGTQFVSNTIAQQTSGLGNGIDVSKAAEGAARGLAEGTVNAFSQGGGFSKVLAGDFPKDLPMRLPALPQSPFNDSTNGSVVAFMRGLSGEGVLLAFQLMSQRKNGSTTGGLPFKRSVESKSVVTNNALIRRQDSGSATLPAPGLAIDSDTLQGIAQFSVDSLTCNGIGGLAALGLGVMNSPALKAAQKAQSGSNDTNPPLDPSTLAALPKDPITITSEGTKFVVNLTDGSITINEMPVVPFAVMTAVHVVLTTFAFFYALPIYLALGAMQRISVMIGHPFNEKKNKKWRTIFLLGLFAPTALVGIIVGMIAMGKSKHFATAHGITGLVALLLLIPTVVTSFMRLRSTSPAPGPAAFAPKIKTFPALFKGPSKIHVIAAVLVQLSLAFAMFSWIQGFTVLRSISLCVVDAVLTAPVLVGLMNAVLFVQISSTAIFIIRQYFENRIAKREAEIAKNGNVSYTENDNEKGMIRVNTMKTFGFDEKSISPSPPPSFYSQDRPGLQERNTAELLGHADSKIGWPVNARNLGEDDALPETHAQNTYSQGPNPFIDDQMVSPSVYDSKIGGFGDDRSFIFPPLPPPPPIDPFSEYGRESRTGRPRPSSELDPQSRYMNYLPRTPRSGDDERPMPMRYASFSRPLTGKKSGEDLRERYQEGGEGRWMRG